MRFQLRRDSQAIRLDQLFRALGFAERFTEVVEAVRGLQVRVNGTTETNPRRELREGDGVSWRGEHVRIHAWDDKSGESDHEPDGHIQHGRRPVRWKEGVIVKRRKGEK